MTSLASSASGSMSPARLSNRPVSAPPQGGESGSRAATSMVLHPSYVPPQDRLRPPGLLAEPAQEPGDGPRALERGAAGEPHVDGGDVGRLDGQAAAVVGAEGEAGHEAHA